MKSLWSKTKNTDDKILSISMTVKFVDAAYDRRRKELEFLRQYDRGEKKITPSDMQLLASVYKIEI